MEQTAQTIILRGKVIITGKLTLVTGLHIGGAAAGLDIGGIDNPIIRHPVTREPYIPGSSLRGKMRSLLERHLGKEANTFIQKREPVVRVHQCASENEYAECAACQIFGLTPGAERKEWTTIKPGRLLVRDVMLAKPDGPGADDPNKALREAKTELPFTEVKWEAAIDRVTAAAVPRQNERVPAGAVFAPLELVYSLYDLDGKGSEQDIAWLKYVFKAMELLEDDYLGGYGSRGAGKVNFGDLEVTFKPHAYYEGTAKRELLGKASNLRQLDAAGYEAKIRQALSGGQGA